MNFRDRERWRDEKTKRGERKKSLRWIIVIEREREREMGEEEWWN